MITEAYGVRHRDPGILAHSSSGGMFTALAQQCLKQKGKVVCTVYDYNEQKPHYVMIDSLPQLEQDHSTKYIQSEKGTVFKDCADYLSQDPSRFLLFTGTGCEAEGFRLFMEAKGLRDQVLIVDLICFGAFSPKIWSDYQQRLQETQGKLTHLNFRDKRNGWKHTCPVAVCEKKEVMIYDLLSLYNQGWGLRPSCYHCPFSRKERRSDMTIGDFWGIEEVIPHFYDPSGASVVLLHSEKGKQFFLSVEDQLEVCPCDWDSVDQPRLHRPTCCPEDREKLWDIYQSRGLKEIENRRKRQRILERGKRVWKRISNRK